METIIEHGIIYKFDFGIAHKHDKITENSILLESSPTA